MTDLSKSQLNAILSALDGQPRNPNTKDAALRRIGAHAERLGISLDALLAAAAGLFDGRMSAEQFRSCLQDDGAEAAGRIEPIEEKAACIGTRCAAPAPASASISEQNSATAAADEGAPSATRTAEAGSQQPSSDEPAAKARKHLDGTKEAMLIDMLRRPEGATIAQIIAVTGVEWGGSALSPCGDRFLHPPLRTGRASFPASGSPCFSSSLRARQNGGSGRSW